MKIYTGNVEPDDNTVFVFGSNLQGRHGAGAAKVAKERFGAIYGIPEGLFSLSYALPTKDLSKKGYRTLSKKDIVENILTMYNVARNIPYRDFKIAYRTKKDELSLCGYSGLELLEMYISMPVPNNIWFSEEWADIFREIYGYEGVFTNHSGGATGSDTYWGEYGGRYGVVSEHYYHGRRTENGNHEITKEEFEEGKEHVLFANKTLQRKPEKYMNLLARNYSQVKHSDEIFAIGIFKKKVVDGGTGWAVQMAIDDGKIVNFFDQERARWFRHDSNGWSYYDNIPTLTRNFAGIGTRNLNSNGIMAIESVYKHTFGSPKCYS